MYRDRIFKRVLGCALSFLFCVVSPLTKAGDDYLASGEVHVFGEFNAPASITYAGGMKFSGLMQSVGYETLDAFPMGLVRVTKKSYEEDKKFVDASEAKLKNAILNLCRLDAQSELYDEELLFRACLVLKELQADFATVSLLGRQGLFNDASVADVQQDLDFSVSPGDLYLMPTRPTHIWLLGQVSSPGAFAYRPDLGITDYLKAAGGDSSDAEPSKAFIVFPDGRMRPIHYSWWNYQPLNIVPGSLIYIPSEELYENEVLKDIGAAQMQTKLINLKANSINLSEEVIEKASLGQ